MPLGQRQPNGRIRVLHRFGVHPLLDGIEPEVRDKVGHGQLEPELPQIGLFLPFQIHRIQHRIRFLVHHVEADHLNLIPRVPITGLVEPDTVIDERVVYRNGLGGDRPTLINDGQGTVVRLHSAVLIIVDPELVHAEIKLPLGDMIRFSLEAHPEFLKAPIAADKSAQYDDGRAQVRHMRPHTTHDALGRVKVHPLPIIFGQDPVPFFCQQLDDPFCHPFFGASDRNLGGVFHALNERQRDTHLVLPHGAPDGGEPLVEAGQGVNAQEG